jgi:hypothetical protein
MPELRKASNAIHIVGQSKGANTLVLVIMKPLIQKHALSSRCRLRAHDQPQPLWSIRLSVHRRLLLYVLTDQVPEVKINLRQHGGVLLGRLHALIPYLAPLFLAAQLPRLAHFTHALIMVGGKLAWKQLTVLRIIVKYTNEISQM